MKIDERIAAFEKLGQYLSAIDEATKQQLIVRAGNENSWFTPESITRALDGVGRYLQREQLVRWTEKYRLEPQKQKVVAVVMAGNIPLVGFHDFLCVLIAGHSVQIKLSSKDSVLIRFLSNQLIKIEPRFSSRIAFVDKLTQFDAVIATGSDNSARYFNFYFSKYPHIIRKNRTSCAVLNGRESDQQIVDLGKDVFDYFGLGCRNVSKVFVPAGYNLATVLDRWTTYQRVLLHHKYHNNYDYQKSILLVNRAPFLDSGFVLLQESQHLVSPISVLFYEYYNDEGDLALKLNASREKIQCIIGNSTPDSVQFGQAQSPMLWDYADQIDTLRFLESLN